MADQDRIEFLKRRREQLDRELLEAEKGSAPPPPPPGAPGSNAPEALPATARALEIMAAKIAELDKRVAILEEFKTKAEAATAKLRASGLFPSFGKKGE